MKCWRSIGARRRCNSAVRRVASLPDPGDVIVIPAGVGHKRVESSEDFGVVGAYPGGRHWDLLRGRPGERPQAESNIAAVPLPENDPIYGPDGSLRKIWEANPGK